MPLVDQRTDRRIVRYIGAALNVNSFRLGGGEAVYVTGRRPEDGVAAAAQAEHLTILPRGVLT